jgi:hypothetical protein
MEEILTGSSINAEPQEDVVDSQDNGQAEVTQSVNEEVAAPQVNEKPVQSAEDNAKYAAIRREYEQKASIEAQNNVPEEYATEMVENKRFREQYEQEKQTISQKQQQEAEYKAFFNAFPEVKPEEIPVSVWEEHSQGKSLADAYTKHENSLLKQKLQEIEKGSKVKETNQNNANSSTGSVNGNGSTGNSYFTREQVQGMSTSEVNQNYKSIIQSMKKW